MLAVSFQQGRGLLHCIERGRHLILQVFSNNLCHVIIDVHEGTFHIGHYLRVLLLQGVYFFAVFCNSCCKGLLGFSSRLLLLDKLRFCFRKCAQSLLLNFLKVSNLG